MFVVNAMATPVSGIINSNTTWNQDVEVTGDITIEAGTTLTILPGVTVEFQGDYLFTVDGILLSEGSIDALADTVKADPDNDVDWVKFTQDTTGLDLYDFDDQEWKYDSAGWDSLWRGIRFNNSDGGSSLLWTIVEFGYARSYGDVEWPYACGGGLFIQSTSPTINRSIVRDCRASKFGGGIYLYGSNSDIRNVVVARNSSDDSGGGMYIDLASIVLTNMTIHRNLSGEDLGNSIYFGPDAIPDIRSSILSYNGDDAEYNFVHPDTILSEEEYADFPYYNAGESPVDGRDVRNTVLTQIGINDLATGNASGFTDSGLNGDLIKYIDDYYLQVRNESVAVDNGDAADMAAHNEPLPNGGHLGSRINSGAWGGTKLAAKSIAVIVACRASGDLWGSTFPRVGFPEISPDPDPIASAGVYVKNIGGGEISFGPEFLSWRSVTGDSINVGLPDATPDTAKYLFWREFTPFSIKPDSIGYFDVYFNPDFDYDALEANGVHDTLAYDINNWLVINTENETFEYRITPQFFNPDLDLVEPSGDDPTLNFNTVHMGTASETLSVILTNDGTTDVEYLSFNTMNHFRWVARHDSTNWNIITPGEIDTFYFHCAPTRYNGEIEETLNITCNDKTYSISMQAVARGAIMDVFPESNHSFDFAFVNQGSSRDRQFNIQNSGNDTLKVDSVRFSDPAFTSNLIDDMVILADSLESFNIIFEPVSFELYEATISIYFDTGDEVEYDLSGRGTRSGVYFSGDIPQLVDGVWEVPAIWGDEVNDDGIVIDSVYVCAGPTTIPPGSSIIIRPGVTVYFDDPYPSDDQYRTDIGPNFIQIEGKLEVLGSEDNIVRFMPIPDENDEDVHGGLRFLSCASGTKMENVVIEGSITYTNIEIVDYLEFLAQDEGIDPVVDVSSPHILAHGGGIALYNCSPQLTNVEIFNCESRQDGGGLWSYQGEPLITNCYIHDNLAGTSGGGVVFQGGLPQFHANRVIANTATSSGGGIHITSNSVGLITNSIINENVSADHGSAILVDALSNPLLLNNIILNNTTTSDNGDGIYVVGGAQPQIINSVIWGHIGEQILADNTNPIVNYSIIDGGYVDGVVINSSPADYDALTYEPLSADPENNNMVDHGNPSGQYDDYSFPPSLNETHSDIGIFGGRYAGYWSDAKLKIFVFADLANRSHLYFVESVEGTNISDVSISIESVGVVTEYTTANGLETIPSVDGIWRLQYSIEEQSFLDITANATVDGIEYSTRRELSISIFKPTFGGSISNPSGASLILPPFAISTDMRIIAESELSANMPEESNEAIEVGTRWSIKSDISSWDKEAEVVLPYDESAVQPGSELGLSIWRQTENVWTRLESYVESGSGRIHASTKKSGTFIVLYEKASENSSYLPTESHLEPNYPNPFNPTTNIPFSLNGATRVEISVFNVLGQKVATVVNGWYTAGQHRVVWDSKDELGRSVASGLYLYRMETTPADGSSGLVQTRKLVLMR